MSDVFDKYYKRYDTWYDKYKFAYLSELEALRKILPKRGKGLEVGVGTGRFAAPLGIHYGIDPSKNMVKASRERGIDARLGVGENLPFEDSIFNYVVIIATLCFVKDPPKVLRESKRILKEEGKIIIGVIDRDSFLGKFYQKKKSLFYKQAYFLGVRDVTNLLRITGFKRISYYQTLFSFPDKITSVEKPQRGFGKGGFVVISAYK